jgi:hypothetical protein
MAIWGDKDRKKLGKWGEKSDDEIVAALNKSEQLETEVTTLKTQVTDKDKAVNDLNTNFQTIKQKLDTLEANDRKQQQQAPPKGDEEEPDFITDPNGAFNKKAQPLANAIAATAAMVARGQAQQSLTRNSKDGIDGRLFDHWGAEIDQVANNTPTHILGNPQTWLGIFLQVKGYHSDELADPNTRKEKYAFLEPSSTVVTQQNTKDKDEQPTDIERKTAEKFGIPVEEYMKRKKGMTFVGA